MDKNNDCYFYFYSTCTKGNRCPFRHCDLALGSEVVCELWRVGRCSDRNCPFRHMEPNINRSLIQCWFETQSDGCRKPHCVFQHTKPRPAITAESLILPTANRSNYQKININNNNSNSQNQQISQQMQQSPKIFNQSNDITKIDSKDLIKSEQLSISIDDEESDDPDTNAQYFDSTLSLSKKNIIKKTNNGVLEPEVKTLEQIKMEKILNFDLTDEHHINENIDGNENNNRSSNIKTNKLKKKSDEIIEQNLIEQQKDFVVKTLEQIRKEREEKEIVENNIQENVVVTLQYKENKTPNLTNVGEKRSMIEENETPNVRNSSKPIKIRRNRILNTVFNYNQPPSLQQSTDQVIESEMNSNSAFLQNNHEIDSKFSNELELLKDEEDEEELEYFKNTTTTIVRNGNENAVVDNIDFEDDELLRELDQMINS